MEPDINKDDDMRRGVYRSIYTALWDDPDFLSLSKDARLVLLNLRSSPLSNIPCIYRFYREAIVEHTQVKDTVLDTVLHTLCDRGWIEVEKGIVWVKNALKYDPSISLNNPKHVEAINRTISGLPKLKIVMNFCTYYGLTIPFDIPHTDGYVNGYEIPYANPGTGTGTGTGTGVTPKPPRGVAIKIPPDIEEVKNYCQQRNKGIDPQRWFDHYEAKGWMIGKNKMKDWKAAVRTWENNEAGNRSQPSKRELAY